MAGAWNLISRTTLTMRHSTTGYNARTKQGTTNNIDEMMKDIEKESICKEK